MYWSSTALGTTRPSVHRKDTGLYPFLPTGRMCYRKGMATTPTSRIKDPRQLPVQLNVTMPWAFREYLRAQAEEQKVSLNKLCVEALQAKYGRGYTSDEALKVRGSTAEAGATA